MEHQRGPLNRSTWPTPCYPYCTTHTLKSQSKKMKPEAVPLCPSFPAPRPPWGRGPTRPCWRAASLQKTQPPRNRLKGPTESFTSNKYLRLHIGHKGMFFLLSLPSGNYLWIWHWGNTANSKRWKKSFLSCPQT